MKRKDLISILLAAAITSTAAGSMPLSVYAAASTDPATIVDDTNAALAAAVDDSKESDEAAENAEKAEDDTKTQEEKKITIIHIQNEDDLREAAENCSLDTYSQDKLYLLDADIRLTEGNLQFPTFGGTFDGQGHTISGLYITGKQSNAGLFNEIQEGGVVKNLVVQGNISVTGTQENTGSIAGVNNGSIRSCSFTGTVKGKNRVGGIAGSNGTTGTVENCKTKGELAGNTASGGIVGNNAGIIKNSTSEMKVNIQYSDSTESIEDISSTVENILMSGDLNSTENISAITDTGGIAGFNSGQIQYCANSGAVGYEHVGYNTGGVAGRSSGLVRGCSNSGEILGRKDVGGIVGQQQPYLAIEYAEDDLKKISDDLDDLVDLSNEVLDNTSNLTDSATDSISTLNSLAGDAKGNIKIITDQAQVDINNTANELQVAQNNIKNILALSSELANETYNYADVIVTELQNSEAAFNAYVENAELTDSEKDSLRSAFDAMEDAANDLLGSADDVSSIVNDSSGTITDRADSLSSAISNIKAAIEGLGSNYKTLQEEVKEKLDQDIDKIISDDATEDNSSDTESTELTTSDDAAETGTTISDTAEGNENADENSNVSSTSKEPTENSSASDSSTSDSATSDEFTSQDADTSSSSEATPAASSSDEANGEETSDTSDSKDTENDTAETSADIAVLTSADVEANEDSEDSADAVTADANGLSAESTAETSSGTENNSNNKEDISTNAKAEDVKSNTDSNTATGTETGTSSGTTTDASTVASTDTSSETADAASSVTNDNSSNSEGSTDASQKTTDTENTDTDLSDIPDPEGQALSEQVKTLETDINNALIATDNQIGEVSDESEEIAASELQTLQEKASALLSGNLADVDFDKLRDLIKQSGLPEDITNELIKKVDTLEKSVTNFKNGSDTLNNLIKGISTDASSLKDNSSEIRSQVGTILGDLETINDAVSSITNTIENYSDRIPNYSDSELKKSVDLLVNSLSDSPDFNGVIQNIITALDGINFSFDGISGEVSAAGNDLYTDLDAIMSEIDKLNNNVSSDMDSSIATMREISAKARDISDIMEDLYDRAVNKDDDSNDIQDSSNIADADLENYTTGRTTSCTNTGTVEADNDVGGIVGTMGVEYDLDPEQDIQSIGSDSIDYSFLARAIVDNCTNLGEVNGRNNYTGGVAGHISIGLVTLSGNSAAVTGTDYIGGVAGYSVGTVRNSYAKCDLSGEKYVGGITGYAEELSGCTSMVNVTDSTQYVGAIAGEVKELDKSRIYDNVFVSDELQGIDGVSYTGIAEPCTYEDIMSKASVPKAFKHIVLTFKADDELVKSVKISYGGSLSEDQIPEIPEKDGFYADWSRTDFTSITHDEVITAEYERTVTLLPADRQRDHITFLFADGNFRQDDVMRVTEETAADDEAERWSVELPDDGSTTHQFRYLAPDGTKNPTLYLVDTETGKRTKLETGTMGEYITFEAEGTSFTFSLKANAGLSAAGRKGIIACAGGGAAAVLLILLILKKKKKNRRRKAAEAAAAAAPEPEETGDTEEKSET